MRRVALGTLLAAAASACVASAGYRAPNSLRGYEILIRSRDSLRAELSAALRRRGFRVRQEITGGGRPTAALVSFSFREPEPQSRPWLHARFVDTRSGVIVAAVAVPLDSVGPDARSRAEAVIEAVSPP